MMRFLTGVEIQRQVSRIVRRGGVVSVAVAYWGTGAAKRTGITRHPNPRQIRLICDLLSGFCNPKEIESLIRLGVRVQTLDRLHAKVWISEDDIVVGSANASMNALPNNDESGTRRNVEAVVMSQDRNLCQEARGWFENQWQASSIVNKRHLVHAEQLWKRHENSAGRGFTATLLERVQSPEPPDKWSGLRLVAYLEQGQSEQAKEFIKNQAKAHFTDEEWADLRDEAPFYEWPLSRREWAHRTGIVLMDFSCAKKGGPFTFNGFWAVRDCPDIPLTESRLTLLTRLPHFNGHSISKQEETGLSASIHTIAESRRFHTDDFGFYIDMDFLAFRDAERPVLKRRLVDQAVETARELCRAGHFNRALTLNAVRRCKEDPAWLHDYARYVGGSIYENRNRPKHEVNLAIGKRIRAGVGGDVETDSNGRRVTIQVPDEIIQTCTALADFNPAAVVAR